MNFTETKVIQVIQETSDAYSIHLKRPENYHWKAGQFTQIKFKDYALPEGEKDFRVFSIASSPEEDFLLFSTRIAEKHSPFKDVILHQLKPGDTILVGEPMGLFHLPEEKETLIIAGGIGITPIRSLLKHELEGKGSTPIQLLYSDDRAEYCYPEFFKEIQEKAPWIQINFIFNREELSVKIQDYTIEKGNEAYYMIAGSPGMNKAIQESLMNQSIQKENIILDNFVGY